MTYPLVSCVCFLDATKFANADSTAEPATQSNVRLPKEKKPNRRRPLTQNWKQLSPTDGSIVLVSYSIFAAFCLAIDNRACKCEKRFFGSDFKM